MSAACSGEASTSELRFLHDVGGLDDCSGLLGVGDDDLDTVEGLGDFAVGVFEGLSRGARGLDVGGLERSSSGCSTE